MTRKSFINKTTNSNLLNKHSCATLSGVFETQTLRVCPTEQIICVKKDLLRKSQNSLTRTFLNSNIHRLCPNFEIGSLVGRNK